MTTTSRKTPAKKATPKRSRTTKTATSKAPKSSTAKATAATKSKASKKAAAPQKAKAAPAATPVQPTVVNAPEAVVVGPAMRKKELIDAVVQRTGLKKRDVRPVVESMLGVIGEAMTEGRELIAQPFGKLRVHKQKTTATKRILFAKLHQNLPPDPSAAKVDGSSDT